MNEIGKKEKIYEGVKVGEKDLQEMIEKIKKDGVKVVYWGGMKKEEGIIISKMEDKGIKEKLIQGEGIVQKEME